MMTTNTDSPHTAQTATTSTATASTITEPLEELEPKQDLSAPGVWNPLPGESPHSYSAFVHYLELGPGASLPRVAQALGRSLTSIQALSARHHWMDRATAYRQHVSHEYLAALEADRAKQARLWNARAALFREHQWEALQHVMLIRSQAGQQLLAKPEKEIAFYEFTRLQDTVCRMARFTGLDASKNESSATSGAPITQEMEDAFQKAYGEPLDLEKYAHLRAVPNPEPIPVPAPEIPTTPAAAAVAEGRPEVATTVPGPAPVPSVHQPSTQEPSTSPRPISPGSTGSPESSGSLTDSNFTDSQIVAQPSTTAGPDLNHQRQRLLEILANRSNAPAAVNQQLATQEPPTSPATQHRESSIPHPESNSQPSTQEPSTNLWPSSIPDTRLGHNLKPLVAGSPGKIIPLKPIPAPPKPKTEDHWAALNKRINTPDAQGNCGAGVHLTSSPFYPHELKK